MIACTFPHTSAAIRDHSVLMRVRVLRTRYIDGSLRGPSACNLRAASQRPAGVGVDPTAVPGSHRALAMHRQPWFSVHGTGQAIVDAIGPSSLASSSKRWTVADRTEDLVSESSAVLLHAHHDGGLEVVTHGHPASSHQRQCSRATACARELLDLLELRGCSEAAPARPIGPDSFTRTWSRSPGLPRPARPRESSGCRPVPAPGSPPCSPDQRCGSQATASHSCSLHRVRVVRHDRGLPPSSRRRA